MTEPLTDAERKKGLSHPRVYGDVHGVVAILHLDYDSLSFLANALPQRDAYTRELQRLLIEVEREVKRDSA